MRNGQVGVRVEECFGALKLLKTMAEEGSSSKVDWLMKPGKLGYFYNKQLLSQFT